MCGIIGCCSNHNVLHNTIDGLKKLEYRGYDSCGITFLLNKEFHTFKSIKRIEDLTRNITVDGGLAVAHTRWATHGKVSLDNAHPIYSTDKKYIIVHNGIIENYLKIKETYLKEYIFYTETDTEIIINLIDYLNKKYSMLDSIKRLYEILEGTFACLILDKNEDKIYFIKNKSPLILGLSNELIVTSDILALPKNTRKYYRLKDGDYGYITKDTYNLFNINDQNHFLFLDYYPLNYDVSLKGFKHYMEKEIYEIPDLLHNYLNKKYESRIINALKNSNKIYLVASGTSFHAASLGALFFSQISKKESYAFVSSEFQIDNTYDEKAIFIVISQSGETADLIKAISKIKKKNYEVIAICNVENSTIKEMSDYFININAGVEIAVASTKSYTLSSLVLYQLSNIIINNLYIEKLAYVINNISNVFDIKDRIQKISSYISNKEHLYYLGKGIDYLLCNEASLKLKEISYIHSESFPAGELKHGSIALISSSSIVIGIITDPLNASLIRSSLEEVKSRGATVFVISLNSLSLDNDTIIINDCDKYLSFISISIILQLLAYYTALNLGNDIDKPRNLAKSVTVE